jgi:DGQHR domain-containing protein
MHESNTLTLEADMTKLAGVRGIELIALESPNIDTTCYRGAAPLAHLSLLSQADVFDQETNPEGLQRDLSPKHASEAYDYAHRPAEKDYPRAFPEVVLNVRDKKVVHIEELGPNPDGVKLFRLSFDLEKMRNGKVSVSRVDGNHRLDEAAGDERREPLLVSAPFQIHVGLTREHERRLFVDINSNQKGMNTSHLAVMGNRLTKEEQEIKDHLDRWISLRLANDSESPWHGLVHLGGSKKGSRAQGLTRPVNFASLVNGVARTLAKSQYIHDLTDPHAQYIVIRNYWIAVKKVFAEEWSNPREYLLLKNMGVWTLGILGGTIIDRCLSRGREDVEEMSRYLAQARNRFDWSRNATPGERAVVGMSGNRAALILAGEMASELSDATGANAMKEIQERLMAQVPR